jgi:hypothetical protein
VIAEDPKGKVIDLERRDLVVVEVGHTDTDHTTSSSCRITAGEKATIKDGSI